VGEVDDETGEIDDGWSLGSGPVGVVDLAVAADRGALLRGEDLEGTGRHEDQEAQPEQRPHHNSKGN